MQIYTIILDFLSGKLIKSIIEVFILLKKEKGVPFLKIPLFALI